MDLGDMYSMTVPSRVGINCGCRFWFMALSIGPPISFSRSYPRESSFVADVYDIQMYLVYKIIVNALRAATTKRHSIVTVAKVTSTVDINN
jgi:hypothetical protein